MRWVWDETKNRENKRRHRLGFETAQLVFDDPLAITIADSYDLYSSPYLAGSENWYRDGPHHQRSQGDT